MPVINTLFHKKTGTGRKITRSGLLLILLVSLLGPGWPRSVCAQEQTSADSTLVKLHSPTKASIFSAVLPGLGQAYNKKYWKIPIVYAGFGLIAYFAISNRNEYRKYKEAYTYVISGDSSGTDNDYVWEYDEQQLLDGKNYHRRNMELSYILGGLWYLLNIVDASVDAHFFDYDVSDDLTIRLDPIVNYQWRDPRPVSGLKLTLKF
jgi:hypothetical protein